MKRNSLLARSLTLGLAVATAAASMSVPGGLMAPETVMAGDAEGATTSKIKLSTDNVNTYLKLADEIAIKPESGDATVDVEYQEGYSAETVGEVTVSFKDKDGKSDVKASELVAGTDYTVFVQVDGNGSDVSAADEAVQLGTGTVTAYDEVASDITLTYKNGENDASGVKNLSGKVFINDVIIDAGNGNKIGTDASTLDSTTTIAKPSSDGDRKVVLFVQKDETTYAKRVTLSFDVTAPNISNVTVNPITENAATVTVTASDEGNSGKLTYSLTQTTPVGSSSTPVTGENGTFKLTALTPNTDYSYTLTVTDEAGNVATYESDVTFTTAKKAFEGSLTIKKGDQALSDAPVIGDKLTATVSDGEEAANYNYQWYRQKDSENATAITGATDQTYTVHKDDFGYKLSFTAALNDGNSESSTSDPTSAVEKKTFDGTDVSNPQYAQDTNKLTVTVADGTSAANYEYVLDASDNWVNGNAEGSILTVDGTTATLDLGNVSYEANKIKIRVAATDEMAASIGVTYEQEITANLAGSVSISGTAKYGQPLTATVTSAQENAALSYQWYRANTAADKGTVIKDATTANYTLTADDIGKYIKVKVTASNYEGEKVSEATAEIAKADARPVADIVVEGANQNKEVYDYTLKALSGTGAKYAKVEGKYASSTAATNDSKDVNWVGSNAFTGLEPNKTYTFFATYEDDECHEVSTEKVLTVTVPKLKHKALELAVKVEDAENSGKKVTITTVDGAEYSFDGGATYASESESNVKTFTEEEITAKSSITVAIQYKADDKYETLGALTQTIDLNLATQEAPSAAKLTFATNADQTKYVPQIADPTDLGGAIAEYSIDGKNFMKAADIEKMEFGANATVNLYVRKQKTDSANASNAVLTTQTTSPASAKPTISGANSATSFKEKLEVTLTAGDGATIYYTTDGSTPTVDEKNKYTAPFTISATKTIKAIAVEDGRIISEVASETFTKEASTVTKPDNTPSYTPSTPSPSTDDKKDDDKKDETQKDDTTNTETKEDGTVVTTTETKAEDGSVTAKVELKNETTGVEATVNVAKDADGKVTEAKAAVTQISKAKVARISADTVSQITEAAGTKDITISTKVLDENGKTVCRVKVNAADLTAGNKVAVLKIDGKTGEMSLVNETIYKVDKNGNLLMDDLKKASYMVLSKSEADAFSKQVLKTVKVETAKKDVTAGKKTKISLDDGLNMNNVAKITYTTSKKSVATVNKNGTISAKKAGKVTVKATVTLKNGKTKTVKMTITVKKSKKK